MTLQRRLAIQYVIGFERVGYEIKSEVKSLPKNLARSLLLPVLPLIMYRTALDKICLIRAWCNGRIWWKWFYDRRVSEVGHAETFVIRTSVVLPAWMHVRALVRAVCLSILALNKRLYVECNPSTGCCCEEDWPAISLWRMRVSLWIPSTLGLRLWTSLVQRPLCEN